MHIRRPVFATWMVVLFCGLAFSQLPTAATDPDKDNKQKEQDERVLQLLDQTIVDAASLKLPENRAVIYALAGDLYWKYDPKKSRELFRNSAGELSTANLDAERERRENTDPNAPDLSNAIDIRSQIFYPLMANRDAPLALELLIQSRPANLVDAIQRIAQGASSQPSIFTGGYNSDTQRAQQELNLERQITLLAARDNIDTAVKALKDMLSKGLSSGNVLALLQTIQRKDEKLAAELASDVVKKILDTDILKDENDFRTAMQMFQNIASAQRAAVAAPPGTMLPPPPMPKPFGFTEAQIHDLAVKFADAVMIPAKTGNAYNALVSLLPTLEKLLPERSTPLRQRLAENQRTATPEIKYAIQRQMLFDSKISPEDTLAQIAKMPNPSDRTYGWQNMQNKILQVDDEVRAKKLIDQIGDDKIRNNIREQFEASRINKAISANRIDEARRQVANLSQKKLQIQKYVALAVQAQRITPDKDSEIAHGLMKDARLLLIDPAEDEDSVTDLMEVVKGYTVVEPSEAFRLFEPVIGQINDVINAASVMARYNKRSRDFRKGELVMRTYAAGSDSILLYRYIPHMQALGAADFDRVSLLIDGFNRNDTREIARMFILQGIIRQERRPVASTAPPVASPKP